MSVASISRSSQLDLRSFGSLSRARQRPQRHPNEHQTASHLTAAAAALSFNQTTRPPPDPDPDHPNNTTDQHHARRVVPRPGGRPRLVGLRLPGPGAGRSRWRCVACEVSTPSAAWACLGSFFGPPDRTMPAALSPHQPPPTTNRLNEKDVIMRAEGPTSRRVFVQQTLGAFFCCCQRAADDD